MECFGFRVGEPRVGRSAFCIRGNYYDLRATAATNTSRAAARSRLFGPAPLGGLVVVGLAMFPLLAVLRVDHAVSRRRRVHHGDPAVETTFQTFYSDLMAHTTSYDVIDPTAIEESVTRAARCEEERREVFRRRGQPRGLRGQQRLPPNGRARPTD